MKNYICKKCGNDKLRWDAWAYWDTETQSFEIDMTTDMCWCDTCEEEPEDILEIELSEQEINEMMKYPLNLTENLNEFNEDEEL